jgi:hypothetical protein
MTHGNVHNVHVVATGGGQAEEHRCPLALPKVHESGAPDEVYDA